jgi:NAD(P)-dependent dehydrogenase (short-subunit alcohol dehydrogenase family)
MGVMTRPSNLCMCSVWMCVCGVAWQDHVITGEGLESTMATNHYGHFLLTTSLLPELNKVRNHCRGGNGPPPFPTSML